MHNKAILLPTIAALLVTNACDDFSSEDVTTRAYDTEVLAPAFADQIESVEVTVSDSDAMVVAFDARGDAIGSLAVWVDDSGVTWLAADFPDGGMLVSADPERESVTRDADMDPCGKEKQKEKGK